MMPSSPLRSSSNSTRSENGQPGIWYILSAPPGGSSFQVMTVSISSGDGCRRTRRHFALRPCEHLAHRRTFIDPLDPGEQARRRLAIHDIGKSMLHAVRDREVADVGQAVFLAGQPWTLGQPPFQPVDRYA